MLDGLDLKGWMYFMSIVINYFEFMWTVGVTDINFQSGQRK